MYGIRSITHIGQKIKECCKQVYNNFYNRLYLLRFDIEDNESMLNLFNMEETPIWFQMVSKTTVAKISERSINVRTFGNDRTRISLILCIVDNGYKAPLLLIVKGKKGGKKEIELKKNTNVLNKKIYVLCQDNAWADSDIFLYW